MCIINIDLTVDHTLSRNAMVTSRASCAGLLNPLSITVVLRRHLEEL